MAASLVLKEERNNDQGKRLESVDPHEFAESDDSTETDDEDDEDEDDDEADDDDDEPDDEDDDEPDDDEDEDGDDDDTNEKDDDDVVDGSRGYDEHLKGIIANADLNKDSKEPDSLFGNNNDKERDL